MPSLQQALRQQAGSGNRLGIWTRISKIWTCQLRTNWRNLAMRPVQSRPPHIHPHPTSILQHSEPDSYMFSSGTPHPAPARSARSAPTPGSFLWWTPESVFVWGHWGPAPPNPCSRHERRPAGNETSARQLERRGELVWERMKTFWGEVVVISVGWFWVVGRLWLFGPLSPVFWDGRGYGWNQRYDNMESNIFIYNRLPLATRSFPKRKWDLWISIVILCIYIFIYTSMS